MLQHLQAEVNVWMPPDEDQIKPGSLTVKKVREFYSILADTALLDHFELSAKEKNVLALRWKADKTLEEIGLRLGMTKEGARKIYGIALEKLKHGLNNATDRFKLLDEQKRELDELKRENDHFKRQNQRLNDSLKMIVVQGRTPITKIEAMSINLSELQMSPRLKKGLQLANIITIGDLSSWNEGRLLGIKRFGRKSLSELEVILQPFHISINKK